MRIIKLLSIILVVLNTLMIPQLASAYSYGNPNEELVALAYSDMVARLSESPPNFQEALTIYETVQEEIDMHMGPEPSQAILNAFDDEEVDKIKEDMEKVLVLNIARRLDNVEKNFSDYNVSKRLLAKAHATYKVLSPVIVEKDESIDIQLTEEFNTALESIGNPGLFGVGNVESNVETFSTSKENILTHLQDVFVMSSLDIGHFSEEVEEDTFSQSGEAWNDISNVKNWLPIILLIAVILGTVWFVKKRK
ncbi:hypothetical protein ACOI1C_03700 [Bacillus sp. DJP31]|uniref:hypothetical protein n=1 Tax=Bacillus sp. DJP31 TaxID=3409789 RepID=UPI003BB6D6BA